MLVDAFFETKKLRRYGYLLLGKDFPIEFLLTGQLALIVDLKAQVQLVAQ